MRVVTFSELKNYGIGYSRVHLSRLIKAKKFPAAIRLSEARIAWLESEIAAWLEARVAERDNRAAA